jgi:hypothetical protein
MAIKLHAGDMPTEHAKGFSIAEGDVMHKSRNNFADDFPDPLNPQFSGGRFSRYFERKVISWRARWDKIRAQQPVRISTTSMVDIMTQINHIKNITSLFSHEWPASFVCSSPADAPDGARWDDQRRTADRGTLKRLTDFIRVEIGDAPARQKSRTRGGGGAMPDQGDAMTKAWTYAVLDALEAADETTRLEIARILCPAGFVIVPTELMELPKRQKN